MPFVELTMNAWIMDILVYSDISLPFPPLRIREWVVAHLHLVLQSIFLDPRRALSYLRGLTMVTSPLCVIQETYNDNNNNNSITGNLSYKILIRAMWSSSCWHATAAAQNKSVRLQNFNDSWHWPETLQPHWGSYRHQPALPIPFREV